MSSAPNSAPVVGIRALAAGCLMATCALAVPPAQTYEDFSTKGFTSGFAGGSSSYGNPGTGGVGGAGDGFLLVTNDVEFLNFGASDFGELFSGKGVDYVASGIESITFWLNDVGDDDPFEIHLSVGTKFDNMWTYTQGFDPPAGVWTEYSVDLTDSALWTRTHDLVPSLTFEDAMHNVSGFVFRNDEAPYVWQPDPIAGDLGIDRIALVPEPATVMLVGLAGFGLLGRRAAGLRAVSD